MSHDGTAARASTATSTLAVEGDFAVGDVHVAKARHGNRDGVTCTILPHLANELTQTYTRRVFVHTRGHGKTCPANVRRTQLFATGPLC